MAQPGHAEDCPGCEWEHLLPEDVAWFKANSVDRPEHRREPVPVKPKSTLDRWIWVMFAGIALSVWVAPEGQLIGPLGAIVVIGIFVGFWVRHLWHAASRPRCPWCVQREIYAHKDRFTAWQVEQIVAFGSVDYGYAGGRVVRVRNAKKGPASTR